MVLMACLVKMVMMENMERMVCRGEMDEMVSMEYQEILVETVTILFPTSEADVTNTYAS